MPELGYSLSSEEFSPSDLVRFARRAEEAGFAFAVISDNFHPWTASKDRVLSSGASSARSLQPQREFDSVPQLDDLCVFLVIKSLSHLENRDTSPPYD
jgi:alkanesulfonate monooxygenase SsuD/methylene tetrahydromethanopterin reductase-like flavin-dependent oxidoreductase (luciferase family)